MVALKTGAPLRVTLALLWLAVPLFPSSLSQAGATQYLSSPEVVIPLKVTSRGRGTETQGWLSYSLLLEGHKHIVHMRPKKLLVSPNLRVFTYTEQHALLEDQPFVPRDCYYHGYVDGAPESLVVFNICFGGFRGLLQISGLNYEIEPIRHSTAFEHLVYRLYGNETQSSPVRCGLAEKEVAHQRLGFEGAENADLKPNSSGEWWTHLWFLELAVVTDHDFFTYSQSNLSRVQDDVFLVVNIVDSVYHQLDTYVILIGIVIWNQGNVFPIIDINKVLEDFTQWKQVSLSQLQHDAAHLFIKSSISILGLAYVASICRPPLNCGVDNFQEDPWSLFANTVAHELGHTFGMQHDEKFCSCGEKGCIMSAFRVPAERFTNCSYDTFKKTTLNQGSCLHSHPRPGGVFWLKRCGNGVVERGEECDCGSIQQCNQDPCCLLNCTLKPGATCAFGLCCKDCKFMPLGKLCRKQVNECDLPEWCNGTSHQCPEDGYVQDGIPCSATAYCYQKQCHSHDQQCRKIFGKGSKSASQNCYKEINSQGSQVGHCGINGTVYLKCNTSDILCGRIQCDNVENVPQLRDHSILQQTHINGVTCWGTKHHFGQGIPDFGEVQDGTSCGAGKICIHKKCVSLSVLSQVCLPETCNMKGICNNKHHCHCNYGWSPPYCLNRGYGGSDDSGPASAKRRVSLSETVFLWGLSLACLLTVGICIYYQIYSRSR
ncbi:disintegrin and metalloproteinase domain-containing protein 21-like [Perognathus longimembris pacificus]|uniref:disintegrin and metalloproteinase domain-containing protein 21-like n=1 Tax=Perognathus longimembris pacificus TaxID=214514 RepID=UPI002019AD16|nr:disintegrin and metalloproteinase domain-containing protein 21-like [Perognathus longimembris pacificus]